MKLLLASVTTILLSASASFAGGLFGEGGLIRGDIGELMDPIENTILTPLAQESVNAGAAAIGGYFGGEVGATIGATVVGPTINDAFGGGGQMMARQPVANPYLRQDQGMMGGFQVEMGNRCLTDAGVSDYGPMNPLGSQCWMGPYMGVVVR